ncbi:SUKH-4 family immunity protein [Streptomyces sp. NPDC102415]|uniref:SUKH-4 family immunity protein n=1 Tax=Streptomyces sp. NPDC102415 TaxID=3366173 RepID=UPI003806C393
MSNGTRELPDNVLDDPARLLDTDRTAIREHIENTAPRPHPGRDVFQQAEAIFGGAQVSRAEFAAWLHFAATMLGHETYARQIAAAEPGMPWRTVWAWWRPVGHYLAHPNLTHLKPLRLQPHNGRQLLRVQAAWENTWLDLETGTQTPAPPQEDCRPLPTPPHGTPRLDDLELYAPESWTHATPLTAPDGRTRHLIADTCGLALLETDPDILRHWPRDFLDHASAEHGTPGQTPTHPAPTGPLTAQRIDEAFAPVDVIRIPEPQLPTTLEHPAARRHLRDIGLPARWACGWTTFTPCPAEDMTPQDTAATPAAAALPDGTDPSELLLLGTTPHGTLHLHRRDGTVHLIHAAECTRLSPDLDHFTRLLEGVRRYMDACWHPRPDEDPKNDFLAEMDALAPGTVNPHTPSGTMWQYFIAGITDLDEDGF